MFSLHPMYQQVLPCYHSFLIVTQNYDSKMTPIGALHAEKIAQAVLLYVFRITFSASPLLLYGSFQFTDLLAAAWTTRLPIDLKLEWCRFLSPL